MHRSDEWHEIPGLEDLANFQVRKTVTKSGSGGDNEMVYIFDQKFMDSKQPCTVSFEIEGGEQVSVLIGKVGVYILSMTISQLQDIIRRFKAIVPSRGPQKRFFMTEGQKAVKIARLSRAARPMRGVMAQKQKLKGYEAGLKTASTTLTRVVESLVNHASKSALMAVMSSLSNKPPNTFKEYEHEELRKNLLQIIPDKLQAAKEQDKFWRDINIETKVLTVATKRQKKIETRMTMLTKRMTMLAKRMND